MRTAARDRLARTLRGDAQTAFSVMFCVRMIIHLSAYRHGRGTNPLRSRWSCFNAPIADYAFVKNRRMFV